MGAGEDWIHYPRLVRRALLGMVRKLLLGVVRGGLPAGHEIYLTFRTGLGGVELPDPVRERYPEEITIVLRSGTFAGLEVDGERFSVGLQFGTLPATVRVPFEALVRIVDPGVQFVLELGAPDAKPAPAVVQAPRIVEAAAPAAEPEPASGRVVSFPGRPRGEGG